MVTVELTVPRVISLIWRSESPSFLYCSPLFCASAALIVRLRHGGGKRLVKLLRDEMRVERTAAAKEAGVVAEEAMADFFLPYQYTFNGQAVWYWEVLS